jgi:hypothetical protein
MGYSKKPFRHAAKGLFALKIKLPKASPIVLFFQVLRLHAICSK